MKTRPIAIVVALALAGAGAAAAVALAGSQPAAPPDATQQTPVEVVEPAADSEPAPQPEPAAEPASEEATFDASAPVTTATTASGLTVTAPEGFLATPELARVEEEIAALTGAGHRVGTVMLDLTTGNALSYNADERLYPASSIKALYCTMVCEKCGGPGADAATMERCLVDSSNKDYEALIDAYGMPAFGAWLAAHGAPGASADGSVYWYPDISARELAACWQEVYRYGTSGEPGSSELVGYLARTQNSPIGATLRGSCEVWAKAGWFPDNGELVATNDAGVVFSASGPYVLVVMTDLSANLDGLRPLIEALDATHATMCGAQA